MKNNSKNRKLLEIRIMNMSKRNEDCREWFISLKPLSERLYWRFIFKYSFLVKPMTRTKLRAYTWLHLDTVGVANHTLTQIRRTKEESKRYHKEHL